MLRSEIADGDAQAAVLAGVRRYQQASRSPRTLDGLEVARVGRARLIAYGEGDGPPVVFVPSLINGPEILDLDAERSLLRWLAARGVRAMLVDWGSPEASEAAVDIGGHVATLLLPLLVRLDRPPILIGYCLGGTMALAAAALGEVRALGLIAAPWDYAGFPPSSRAALTDLWAQAGARAGAIGLLPMEVLQIAFWRLDPQRTLAKFAAFAARDESEPVQHFVAVEDWANHGPPMTFAAARQLMEEFFGANVTGRGAWSIDGKTVDPRRIAVPTLEIVSTTDRIVPAAAAVGLGRRLPLALGHVGMIVGSRGRAAVWEPLADWIAAIG